MIKSGFSFFCPSHTLTVAEMPSHNHGGSTGNDTPNHSHGMDHTHTYGTGYAMNYGESGNGNYIQVGADHRNVNYNLVATTSGSSVLYTDVTNTRHSHSISAQGNSGAHNNMPPYIIKYCWERIA